MALPLLGKRGVMKNILRTFLSVSCLLVMGQSAVGQGATPAPSYTNAQVVSVDPVRRLVMIRKPTGLRETFQLDDVLAGPIGVAAGDRVILTVHGGPGRRRISAISKVTESPVVVQATATPRPVVVVVNASPSPQVSDTTALKAEGRASFANQVATLSQEARPIDGMWASFVTSCNVKPTPNEGGGRDWFGLWDGRVQSDLSTGVCRDLFNQIVSAGEGIKRAMASAEDVAQKMMTVGEIRDVRRMHLMNWDGWRLPAPQKREP